MCLGKLWKGATVSKSDAEVKARAEETEEWRQQRIAEERSRAEEQTQEQRDIICLIRKIGGDIVSMRNTYGWVKGSYQITKMPYPVYERDLANKLVDVLNHKREMFSEIKEEV